MTYFGSVKFFKHLIISILIFILIFPYALSVYLTFENNELRERLHRDLKNISNNIDTDMLLANVSMTLEKNEDTNNSILSFNTEKISQFTYDEALSYQLNYKDLYVDRKSFVDLNNEEKTAYLTFDDGPSDVTLDILDTLDEYNIKATFFVIYKNDEKSLEIYKEIVKRGHTIGVHSASHKYKQIYNSVDDYLDDFNKIFMHIYEVTGVKPKIFRYPGGSINSYNMNIYEQLNAEMLRRGFVFYDWNVSSGDAEANYTKSSIISSVTDGVKNYNKIIILMHDSETKRKTAESLYDIIENLKNKGFQFNKLDSNISPITFSYKD